MIACYFTLMERRKPLTKRAWSLDSPVGAGAIQRHPGAPGIIKRLTEEVRNFAGNFPQHDDITLIAIRKR
jgi:hypothetical protein